MAEPNLQLGTFICEQRRKNKETQQELADSLGVSRELVKSWEAGQRRVKIEHLRSIAKHFRVSAEYMIGLGPSPKNKRRTDNE